MKKIFSRWPSMAILSFSFIAVLAVSSVFVSCKKDKTLNMPTLTTDAVINITSTAATAGGEVTNNGGATVTASGVVYSTVSGPTVANNYTTDGTASGMFTSSLADLTPNTTYYVRAYATNSAGTAYGSEVNFTTLP